jgi:hypothetical protein
MSIPFWVNEPTILFNKDYIFDLWPMQNMYYEEKLNSITRLIILITILGYILTKSIRIIVTGVISILIIFVLFKMKKDKLSEEIIKENFSQLSDSNPKNRIINPVTLESVIKSDFQEGTKNNPFSNVLLTEINDNPDRKSAPPSFNPNIEEDITKNVKRAVQKMNPGINNTNKQLFGDMWQNFELDQSNRQFFSTANTRVTNDQGAFAQFLYNDLKYSAKESTPEGAIARVKDAYRYTLY